MLVLVKGWEEVIVCYENFFFSFSGRLVWDWRARVLFLFTSWLISCREMNSLFFVDGLEH